MTGFWTSRLLVLTAGPGAYGIWGVDHHQVSLNDGFDTGRSFGDPFNALLAPSVRWDAIRYVDIATHGYRSVRDTAFFRSIRGSCAPVRRPAARR
ncbi:MAG: hypothetical protein ACR2NH_09385 [Solirubrobacteraceae bacterium]